MPAITSTRNDRVKQVVRLQTQSRERRKAGRFCIEHQRDLRRAVSHGYIVHELYRGPALGDGLSDLDAEQTFEVTEAVLAKMSYREHPEPFVAVLGERRTALEQLSIDGPPLIVVCSGLEKPGNLGAVLRSADAAGADAVFVDSPKVDLYNPNCIRASTGAVFGLPVVCDSPDNLRDWLARHEVLMLAAMPEARMTYLSVHLRGPTALIVGAEAEGLDTFWRGAADLQISIPMTGRVADSLNVSVTAAVLLFEAMRQRTG